MMSVSPIIVLVSLLLIIDCTGFVPVVSRPTVSFSQCNRLHSTHGGYYSNDDGHNEGDYRYMLNKARDFVETNRNSVSSIITDTSDIAQLYLQSIISLQKDCMLGTVTGDDLCNIDDDISEIVYNLKEMINDVTTNEIVTSDNSMKESSSIISPNIVLFMFILTASFMTGVMQNQWNANVQPFTIDEWMYAFKGGYLDIMIQHYIRNGGI